MIDYRKSLVLLLGGVLTAAAVSAQSKKSSADEADQKELYNYVLTLDKIRSIAAINKSFEELAKKNPGLKDKEGDAKNLDEMAQKLQKYPEVVAVIEKNGMKTREFAVATMSLLQVGMVVGFKKSGTYKEYPPEMLKLVSKQNLAFAEEHWDEIQKLTNSDQ
jgi:hypothetical protein